jgi:aminopeptidase N
MKFKRSLFILVLLFVNALPPARSQEFNSCAISRNSASLRQPTASPEHKRLMDLYDITFYKLDLNLERNSIYIEGNVSLSAKVRANTMNVFAFELHQNFQIDSVLINTRRAHNINRLGSEVTIGLNTPVSKNSNVTAKIYYKGVAPNDNSAAIGNGFNTATERNWGNQVTWSLSEPYAAYEWWPTKQVLTDKADSVHVFITTTADNKVGSNGILTNVVELPGNKIRYEWKSRYPIDYYLVSVAVSNYEEYIQQAKPKGASAPIPIVNYIYRGGALSTFKAEMDRTPGFIEHFSELFGLYPFHKEKYGHSMAPLGGGMEHQTMTTQSTFTFTLTAHELAHQWFGDNVTCASWQDIWLNEGFASYSEYLALQHFQPNLANQWIKDAHLFALQRPTGSVKVSDTLDVGRIFDYRLSYKKGASIIHMLRFELNDDELFFDILRAYQKRHEGSTANTNDFKKIAEQIAGKSLTYFFDQWYSGEGYPIFQVQWKQEGNRLLLVTQQQGSGKTAFFNTDMEYRITTTSGDTTIRVMHFKPNQKIVTRISGTATAIEVDPKSWILKQVASIQQNPALQMPVSGTPVLYPNPIIGNRIQVSDLNFAPNIAVIYDVAGRAVSRQQLLSSSEVIINVAALAAGHYHLYLSNGIESYRASFIKLK